MSSLMPLLKSGHIGLYVLVRYLRDYCAGGVKIIVHMISYHAIIQNILGSLMTLTVPISCWQNSEPVLESAPPYIACCCYE